MTSQEGNEGQPFGFNGGNPEAFAPALPMQVAEATINPALYSLCPLHSQELISPEH
jgi:hypothetical protein